MLRMFHRTEVFITYSKDNLDKVLKIFDLHGIEYTIKTTKVEDEYMEGELDLEYKVFVSPSIADEAQRLVKETLFA